jgi:hypothetical protein
MSTTSDNTNNKNGKIMPYSLPSSINNQMSLNFENAQSNRCLHQLQHYMSSNTPNSKNYKNQKITKTIKFSTTPTFNSNIIHIPPTPEKTTPTTTQDTQDQQYIPPSPQRQWRNLGGNALQRLLDAPTDSTPWQPTTLLPLENQPQNDFSALLHESLLRCIDEYSQCPRTTTILRLKRKPDVHITTKDLRDTIQHNTPIYHESLILCLEVICTAYEGTYVDPSFIATLKTLGWTGVANRFVSPQRSKIDQPHSDHPNNAIPVHVNGNHRTALCRRIINGVIYFIYADDLNMPCIEAELKRLLQSGTSSEFYPPGARWISCTTPIYRPHSNECGHRTMLALAVMVSHPAPHPKILHPHMSTNLAQYSRHWMSYVLLMGIIPLLPHTTADNSSHQHVIESNPATLISWPGTQNTERQPQKAIQPQKHKTSTNLEDYSINSPKHQLINKIQQVQQEIQTFSPHKQGKNQSAYRDLITIQQQDPSLPKIVGAQKKIVKSQSSAKAKKKQPRPPTQLTLLDTMKTHTNSSSQVDRDWESWGHYPKVIDTNTTFRIFYNNPNFSPIQLIIPTLFWGGRNM